MMGKIKRYIEHFKNKFLAAPFNTQYTDYCVKVKYVQIHFGFFLQIYNQVVNKMPSCPSTLLSVVE